MYDTTMVTRPPVRQVDQPTQKSYTYALLYSEKEKAFMIQSLSALSEVGLACHLSGKSTHWGFVAAGTKQECLEKKDLLVQNEKARQQ